MEAEVRSTPTADDLLRDVREGVEEIVRVALEEAERLHLQADETLQQYDATPGIVAASMCTCTLRIATLWRARKVGGKVLL